MEGRFALIPSFIYGMII